MLEERGVEGDEMERASLGWLQEMMRDERAGSVRQRRRKVVDLAFCSL
jgi:hypothetical protein